jgi:hypothetical protein
MTETVTAVRLSRLLIEAAKQTGALHSRSIAGQVEHWARLGMALEAAPDVQKALIDDLLRAGRARLESGQASQDFAAALEASTPTPKAAPPKTGRG